MVSPPPTPSRETSGKLEKLPEGTRAPPKNAKDLPQTALRPPLPLRALAQPLGPTASVGGWGAGETPPRGRRLDLRDLQRRVSSDPGETPILLVPEFGGGVGGGSSAAELEQARGSWVQPPAHPQALRTGQAAPPSPTAHSFQHPFPCRALPRGVHSPDPTPVVELKLFWFPYMPSPLSQGRWSEVGWQLLSPSAVYPQLSLTSLPNLRSRGTRTRPST